MTQHSEPTLRPDHDHPVPVVVRTISGHTHATEVRGADTVAAFTSKEVSYFQSHHQLGAGSYALTLPRRGDIANLDPGSTLTAVGVHAGDVLVLIERSPQVDG